jgi:methyl-accepting chemotaxis protein
MKKVVTRYIAIFTAASFAGAFSLRWLALEFLYHQMGDFWSGIGSTIVATGGLAVIIGFFLIRCLSPLERVAAKARRGEAITVAEREEALGVYAKVNRITIAANVIGFVIGQFVVMFMDVRAGVVPYHLSCCVIIMIQSLLVGAVAALYEIYSLNIMMARYRSLLGIHSIEEFGKGWDLSLGAKVALTSAVGLLYMGCNAFSAAYGIIALPGTIGGRPELGTYLRFGMEAVTYSFAACFGLVAMIARDMRKRIAATSARLRDLGQKGDLSSRISLSMNDDFGALMGDLNGFIGELARLVKSIRDETDVVAESAEGLARAAGDSFAALGAIRETIGVIEGEGESQGRLIATANSGVRNMAENAAYVEQQVLLQSSAAEQSSASVDEMAANIASVAELSQKAGALSVELTSTSGQGTAAIDSAVASIQEIKQASASVREIVQDIQKIASRTNLLSMNAAIEAAHAGEAGRGFAIVADEVRSLASSSAKSAKEIKGLIEGMVAKIDHGVASISSAGKSFAGISEGIAKSSELMDTIIAAMEEQKAGAKETIQATSSIVSAIQTIRDLSRKQREYAEAMAKDMELIVESSRQISSALGENKDRTGALDASIQKVKLSIGANGSAVSNMRSNVAVFRL